jgi:hypothetical protein
VSDLLEEFGADEPRAAELGLLRARLRGDRTADPLAPGARCLLLRRGREPAACLSWEIGELHGVGRCAIAGHFETADVEAGVRILRRAQELTAAAGGARLVGPMNGSTWADYRLALRAGPGEPAAEPAFSGEPRNPVSYHYSFLYARFTIAARYESRIADLPVRRPRAAELARRMERLGITARPLDPERFEEEVRALFDLSEAAFAGNPYYRRAPFPRVLERYAGMRALLDPELARLAHDRAGRLVGFVLAFPDLLTARDGRPARLVLKTLATTPTARALGAGAYLADQVHELACRRGYEAVIHALMHETNESMRLSRRYRSRPFRRYALYEWAP